MLGPTPQPTWVLLAAIQIWPSVNTLLPHWAWAQSRHFFLCKWPHYVDKNKCICKHRSSCMSSNHHSLGRQISLQLSVAVIKGCDLLCTHFYTLHNVIPKTRFHTWHCSAATITCFCYFAVAILFIQTVYKNCLGLTMQCEVCRMQLMSRYWANLWKDFYNPTIKLTQS